MIVWGKQKEIPLVQNIIQYLRSNQLIDYLEGSGGQWTLVDLGGSLGTVNLCSLKS